MDENNLSVTLPQTPNSEAEEAHIDSIAESLTSVLAAVDNLRPSRRSSLPNTPVTPAAPVITSPLQELVDEAKKAEFFSSELCKLLQLSFITGDVNSSEELEPSVEFYSTNASLKCAIFHVTEMLYRLKENAESYMDGEGHPRLYQKVRGFDDILIVDRLAKAGFLKPRAQCHDLDKDKELVLAIHKFAEANSISMDKCHQV
ncbi:hypothetical protein RchiOBHm_Chr7g0184141 [Rosa chinensis]|uniref:Uncharacterized protein n=1 Tax=Rosa chinensis TaxID=74649 RepID=A0A2P6P3B9_ROSCH|nr:hypothetical protein RchiOBHm_Chr7g0184141 [Rosa chinensis]